MYVVKPSLSTIFHILYTESITKITVGSYFSVFWDRCFRTVWTKDGIKHSENNPPPDLLSQSSVCVLQKF